MILCQIIRMNGLQVCPREMLFAIIHWLLTYVYSDSFIYALFQKAKHIFADDILAPKYPDFTKIKYALSEFNF
jgi:hypothetical protein